MKPDRIGRYPVAERIGQGGVGIVYRAHDPVLDRPVAIKVLSETWVDDAAQVARFEREARTLARFNHPNIATIYGVAGANLVLLPIATKIRERARRQEDEDAIVIEGMVGLQSGISPRTLERILQAHLTREEPA